MIELKEIADSKPNEETQLSHRSINVLRLTIITALIFIGSAIWASAQVWQWSVPVTAVVSKETNDHPQAFLWIPENCKQVNAVVFGQHNMIEEGILEHPAFRSTMTDLGIATVWVTPGINMSFDFNNGAGNDFDSMMNALAEASGYKELATAPVVPIGHSAYATFPWNFAAWDPARTLALVSVHGDAPQTPLTGYGGKNVTWGNHDIDGVPALFIMGEYEWWEDRIQPGFAYVKEHPASPISFFCDAGHGHFDYSDEMVAYVAMFIRKAVQYRLPANHKQSRLLLPVDPQNGWLMDRWRKDSLPLALPAPYKTYKGNKYQASWVFDRQMAKATEAFYVASRCKKAQWLGFIQNDTIVHPKAGHAQYTIPFIPLEDGISFRLKAFYADSSRTIPVTHHADVPVLIDRICGPVKKLDDSTFQIAFYRMGFNNPKRSGDIWLLAHSKGDEQYKSAVQQLNMHIPVWNKTGKPQAISFPVIASQTAQHDSIVLQATATAGLPVHYYVKEGPAFIKNNTIYFTKIPPKAKYPVRVSVVAWQYGIKDEIQSAEPVEQFFLIKKEGP